MDTRYFSDKVVKWYELNKRDLPWRETIDPYKVWVSEIILQQTRVNQGLPYYLNFIKSFPTVRRLASASEEEVLRLWQGLGYYTRARNLHKCARQVVNDYGGAFPNTYIELKKLAGIGDYTAAAIASFCYREHVAVLDGNVFRVLSRVFGIDDEIKSSKGQKTFKKMAATVLSRKYPDRHNQAVMEFGALHCTPKSPGCLDCIFSADCFANLHDLQASLPVVEKLKTAKKRYFYYFVIQKGKSLAMKKRALKDIWHGLYDFLLIEKPRPTLVKTLVAEVRAQVGLEFYEENMTISSAYKHVLSHQHIYATFIVVHPIGSKWLLNEPIKFYSSRKISSLPKPVLISKFLKDHQLL